MLQSGFAVKQVPRVTSPRVLIAGKSLKELSCVSETDLATLFPLASELRAALAALIYGIV